jgi:hypothetical protein
MTGSLKVPNHASIKGRRSADGEAPSENPSQAARSRSYPTRRFSHHKYKTLAGAIWLTILGRIFLAGEKKRLFHSGAKSLVVVLFGLE